MSQDVLLAQVFHTSKALMHRPPGPSSVRSAMFIARFHGMSQAPSGAACRPTTSLPEPPMPLLTELENPLLRPPDYKHGAPKCSLRSLTCLQVQVLPRQWMVGPSSHSRPWTGETPVGASSAVNGRACRRRKHRQGRASRPNQHAGRNITRRLPSRKQALLGSP
jgi:hypothetical protein